MCIIVWYIAASFMSAKSGPLRLGAWGAAFGHSQAIGNIKWYWGPAHNRLCYLLFPIMPIRLPWQRLCTRWHTCSRWVLIESGPIGPLCRTAEQRFSIRQLMVLERASLISTWFLSYKFCIWYHSRLRLPLNILCLSYVSWSHVPEECKSKNTTNDVR